MKPILDLSFEFCCRFLVNSHRLAMSLLDSSIDVWKTVFWDSVEMNSTVPFLVCHKQINRILSVFCFALPVISFMCTIEILLTNPWLPVRSAKVDFEWGMGEENVYKVCVKCHPDSDRMELLQYRPPISRVDIFNKRFLLSCMFCIWFGSLYISLSVSFPYKKRKCSNALHEVIATDWYKSSLFVRMWSKVLKPSPLFLKWGYQ